MADETRAEIFPCLVVSWCHCCATRMVRWNSSAKNVGDCWDKLGVLLLVLVTRPMALVGSLTWIFQTSSQQQIVVGPALPMLL